MIRRVIWVAVVLLLTACNNDAAGATSPLTDGTLNFQIDSTTCLTQGSFDIELFIDHASVGAPTMAVGTVASFSVAAGTHTVGATAVDGRFVWGFESVEVPARGEYTAILGCR